jgi:predicted DNA-binding transcriptional regulator YafY
MSVRELADRVGSSKSTIERDLATLERHFPLAEEHAGEQLRRYRITLPCYAITPGIERGGENVDVVFSRATAAEVAARVFHPDERKTALPNGQLRYQVQSARQREIVAWVLSFGGEAELRTPTAWREELQRRAVALLAVHRETAAQVDAVVCDAVVHDQ